MKSVYSLTDTFHYILREIEINTGTNVIQQSEKIKYIAVGSVSETKLLNLHTSSNTQMVLSAQKYLKEILIVI